MEPTRPDRTSPSETPSLHGRVVVGFDGSPHAELALERAAEEAARRHTSLEILCGWPWPRHTDEQAKDVPESQNSLYHVTRRHLDQAAERARTRAPGLAVIPSVTSESAAEALVRCGSTASLTVVGTRGYGGFAGLLLGSVSLRVAAHCETPLMVVGERPEYSRGTVLLGVEPGSGLDTLAFGFEEAGRRGASLCVLHAWQYPASYDAAQPTTTNLRQEAVERAAEEAAAVPANAVAALRAKYPDVPVRTAPRCGPAGGVLVEESREADVVVLGVRRARHRLGLQLGPVTHALLHHSHCPVVLVPEG
ncbi:universal stress protein [Streptomyces sp. NPDC054796]